MAKSRDAFRTISEVAEALDTPAHVLRFWESKFRQIKPVKRAGGRRYYRPDDVALLACIKDMLHNRGHSIKNAQKLIREAGIKAIIAEGHSLLGSSDAATIIDAPALPPPSAAPGVAAQPDLFGPSSGSAPSETSSEPAPAQTAATDTVRNPMSSDAGPTAPVAPATVTAKPLPDLPEPRPSANPRLLASLASVDSDRVRTNGVQITALVDRLSSLRDEMRHPW